MSLPRLISPTAPPLRKSLDTDLSAVVEAWPSVPESLKAGIVAMVRAAG